MGKPSHTAGPWEVCSHVRGDKRIYSVRSVRPVPGPYPADIVSGDEVDQVTKGLVVASWATDCEADARLIAAAPELVEASRALLEWYDRDGSVGGICDPMEELRAAIRKATGEQS